MVLTAVSGAIACDNIGNADSREEKNEIFVEFVGEAAGSVATTVVLGLIFTTTPLGWVAALAIGGAGVAAGWASGKLSKSYYDNKFKEIDLVAGANIDKWCN